VSLGRLPYFSKDLARIAKPLVIESIQRTPWVKYGDEGIVQEPDFEEPSNICSVQRCFCELSEIVHRALYVLYTPGGNLTSRDVLDLYSRYMDWYSSLPGLLRVGVNSIPCVLFLQYVPFPSPSLRASLLICYSLKHIL
jgi:hypothetical protein